jgi:hypothetical protein
LTKGTLVGDFNQWDVAATPLPMRPMNLAPKIRSSPSKQGSNPH